MTTPDYWISFALQEAQYNDFMRHAPHSQHAPETDDHEQPADSLNWLAGVDDSRQRAAHRRTRSAGSHARSVRCRLAAGCTYRSMREIERLVYQPRIPAMPQITTGSELQANIQATQPEDERYADLAKIILQSAYRNGWNSNEIAGHRDLDMGGGKWHRLISLIGDRVERDREGTRIIDGTLREFYAEMEAGRIEIG